MVFEKNEINVFENYLIPISAGAFDCGLIDVFNISHGFHNSSIPEMSLGTDTYSGLINKILSKVYLFCHTKIFI
jgi:hypothetical protein